MKHLNIIALCIAALTTGLIISIPLFTTNVSPKTTFERPFITLDVPYAYFYILTPNQSVTKLNPEITSSILIANITNYSDQTVHIDELTLYAANYLNVTNTQYQFSLSSTGIFYTQELSFNTYSSNSISASLRPHESKLIALSGTTDTGNTSALQTGIFYLGGKVEGSIQDWHSTGGGAEQVEVKKLDSGYLYNNLLLSNQTLHLQGNRVNIDRRIPLHPANKEELEGTTYQVYIFAIKAGKPVNTRNVRKGLNLSSPSVAFRHLQKLEALGLLEKNDFGEYVVKEKIRISGNIWFGRNLVPRLLMYCLFFVGLLIIELTIIAIKQSLDLNFAYLTAITCLAVIIFLAEGFHLYKQQNSVKNK